MPAQLALASFDIPLLRHGMVDERVFKMECPDCGELIEAVEIVEMDRGKR